MDVIGKYLFEDTSLSSDSAIVYYISGYIARNLIKNMGKCPDCAIKSSPGKVQMETKFDDVEGASADKVHAKGFFVKFIIRCGLIEPSDALYVIAFIVRLLRPQNRTNHSNCDKSMKFPGLKLRWLR